MMSASSARAPITVSSTRCFHRISIRKRINLLQKAWLLTNSYPLTTKLGFASCNGFRLGFKVLPVGMEVGSSRALKFVVRVNGGFGFNGGGGDGGWDKNSTVRVLGNLTLAIGLTYLSMTGQLGWVFDTIVSISILAVLLPIAGIAAFFLLSGRDIVQSSCPNCGNDFQIFKSSMQDGPQLCPFCCQTFSVQGNTFVRESTRFSSNRSSSTFGQIFNGFSSSKEKGKKPSSAVVDIEAEVRDIE